MADQKGDNSVLQLSIERKRKAVKAADEETKLEALFKALGGDGKIRVHRRLPGATSFAYLATLDASDTVCDELEETLCQMFGGGDFKIVGRHKGEDLGSAYVSIDVRQHPPRTVAPEGSQGAANASDAKVAELTQLLREQQARLERLAEQRSGDLQGFASMQLGMMREMAAERQQAATQQLQLVVTALTGQRPNQAPEDPLKKAREVVGFAKELKELGGGDSGSDSRSMVERVLEAPLTAAGTRIVDKLFSEDKAAAAPAPAAAKPAPQLPAAQPAASAPPPAAPAPVAAAPAPTPPPRSAGAAPMPAGFKPLSRADLAAARERARANAGGAPTTSTASAPDLRQVHPEKR